MKLRSILFFFYFFYFFSRLSLLAFLKIPSNKAVLRLFLNFRQNGVILRYFTMSITSPLNLKKKLKKLSKILFLFFVQLIGILVFLVIREVSWKFIFFHFFHFFIFQVLDLDIRVFIFPCIGVVLRHFIKSRQTGSFSRNSTST